MQKENVYSHHFVAIVFSFKNVKYESAVELQKNYSSFEKVFLGKALCLDECLSLAVL